MYAASLKLISYFVFLEVDGYASTPSAEFQFISRPCPLPSADGTSCVLTYVNRRFSMPNYITDGQDHFNQGDKS